MMGRKQENPMNNAGMRGKMRQEYNYRQWLVLQTAERKTAALEHLDVCRRLGEAQRESPYSDECKLLSDQVAKYYLKWDQS